MLLKVFRLMRVLSQDLADLLLQSIALREVRYLEWKLLGVSERSLVLLVWVNRSLAIEESEQPESALICEHELDSALTVFPNLTTDVSQLRDLMARC